MFVDLFYETKGCSHVYNSAAEFTQLLKPNDLDVISLVTNNSIKCSLKISNEMIDTVKNGSSFHF